MANRLATSQVNGKATAAAPPTSAVAARSVSVIGPARAGKQSLIRALQSATGGVAFRVETRTSPPSPTSGVLLVLNADADETTLESHLHEFAELLNHWLAERGRNLEVAALPVFLALTKCDLLESPGQSRQSWVEAVEQRRLAVAARLKSLAPGLTAAPEGGFGGIAMEVVAVAVGAGKPAEAFGIAELAQRIERDTRSYAERVGNQLPRIRLIAFLATTMVFALLVGATAWGVFRLGPLAKTPPITAPTHRDDEYELYRERAEKSACRWPARAPLRRPGFRKGLGLAPLGTSSDSARDELNQLIGKFGRRYRFMDDELFTKRIGVTRQRLSELLWMVELFGLADTIPESKDFGLLRIPAPKTGVDPNADYERMRMDLQGRSKQLHWTMTIEPPSEVPWWVVRQLQNEAWVNYEKLVRPVAGEVRRRVLELGKGKETPEAWKALADGWLAREAAGELGQWRKAVKLLQRMAGEAQPVDPLAELRTFLREDPLFLDVSSMEFTSNNLDLRVPTMNGDGKIEEREVYWLKSVGKPLVIERRSAKPDEAIHRYEWSNVNDYPRTPFAPTRMLFVTTPATAKNIPDGIIPFRPSDQIRATLEVIDGKDQPWLLTWTPADSPSSVFSFGALDRPPRIHSPKQTDPLLGVPAVGVRLRFADPRAVKLPDLIAPPTSRP